MLEVNENDLKFMLVKGSMSTSRFDLRHPLIPHFGHKVDAITRALTYADLILRAEWTDEA